MAKSALCGWRDEYNTRGSGLWRGWGRVFWEIRMMGEKIRTAAESRRASAYNRSLLEASVDPLVTIGPDGRITDVNRATEQVTGRPRQELVGTDFSDYFTDSEKARAGYREVFEKGEVRDYALEIKGRDGRTTPVLYNATVYRDEAGKVVGVFAAARDVTDRRRAEETLRRVGAYNRSLLEASVDPLVTIGPDGRITDVNRATETITGRPRQELVGTDFSDYFTEPEQARAGYREVFEKGEVRDYALEVKGRDGKATPVLYNATVYRDEGGKVIGVFAAARDVSELKRIMAELQRSNADLEQFAYVASHDLQEPLRMVGSFTQLLGERYRGKLDEKADKWIGYATQGAATMQRLIDDLLAYSRVRTRAKPLEPVDSSAALDEALANLRLALQESRAEVSREPLPRVMADQGQLVHVFQNLIGNALKFHGAEPPRIRVAARRGGPDWVFSVQDNGIGIEPQYFDRIFMIFQRLHARNEYPGSGVGLAICKQVVQRHGGRIWVESVPGQGSTFRFTMPAETGGTPS
jgi:PAS domain S-box-containing protein